MSDSSDKATPSQLDKFLVGADEDETRWDERLKTVARHKPAPEAEKPE